MSMSAEKRNLCRVCALGGLKVPGTCGRVRVVGFGGFVMVDPSVRRLRVRLHVG